MRRLAAIFRGLHHFRNKHTFHARPGLLLAVGTRPANHQEIISRCPSSSSYSLWLHIHNKTRNTLLPASATQCISWPFRSLHIIQLRISQLPTVYRVPQLEMCSDDNRLRLRQLAQGVLLLFATTTGQTCFSSLFVLSKKKKKLLLLSEFHSIY